MVNYFYEHDYWIKYFNNLDIKQGSSVETFLIDLFRLTQSDENYSFFIKSSGYNEIEYGEIFVVEVTLLEKGKRTFSNINFTLIKTKEGRVYMIHAFCLNEKNYFLEVDESKLNKVYLKNGDAVIGNPFNGFHHQQLKFELGKIIDYEEADVILSQDSLLKDEFYLDIADNTFIYQYKEECEHDFKLLERMFKNLNFKK